MFLKIFTETENYEYNYFITKNEQEQYTLINEDLSLQEYWCIMKNIVLRII